MTYKVKGGSAATSYVFNATDTVTSVLQNLALLYATKQGTVPQYREFGLPMEFIDKPMPVAQTMAVAEITEATEKFEPRATIVDISFEVDNVTGKLSPIVEVEINESN